MSTPVFEAPSWLQDQDADTIHQRMMDALPADIDNTQGGFPWDLTRPTALEKAEMLEFHLVETIKLMFPAWAYAEWLDLHARRNNLTRKPATSAYGALNVTGIAGTEIPAGFIFAVPAVGARPAVEFYTEEDATIGEDGAVAVGVIAVEPGAGGNVPAGSISIMAQPMKGITGITNPERTSGGTETESDDSLRERIAEAEQAAEASFVGCDGDYIRWAKEVPGVGTAFVVPQWNPEQKNSVKVAVLDANGEPANDRIIEDVYAHIMAPDNRIERKAPIGALVTVAPPTVKNITYAFKATLRAGYDGKTVVSDLTESIRQYYTTAKSESLVKYNEIHAIITRSPGVYDFTGLTINGGTVNIALADDEYPITTSIDPGVPLEVAE